MRISLRVWMCVVRCGRSVILYGELLGYCWSGQLVTTRYSPQILGMCTCRIPRSDVLLAGGLCYNKAEYQVQVSILLLCFWEIMNSILDSETSSQSL